MDNLKIEVNRPIERKICSDILADKNLESKTRN
jgi:hypothetical protein